MVTLTVDLGLRIVAAVLQIFATVAVLQILPPTEAGVYFKGFVIAYGLAALLRGVQLPPEWPTETLHAAGELDWPLQADDMTRALTGRFDLETQGGDRDHQLVANASLDDGQIRLDNVRGSGPAPDQVFRGSGRVSLVARNYDLTVDYEQVALAATAMPTPARAPLTRAWNALRGSVTRRGVTADPETRRVQWHGSWEGERAEGLDSK